MAALTIGLTTEVQCRYWRRCSYVDADNNVVNDDDHGAENYQSQNDDYASLPVSIWRKPI